MNMKNISYQSLTEALSYIMENASTDAAIYTVRENQGGENTNKVPANEIGQLDNKTGMDNDTATAEDKIQSEFNAGKSTGSQPANNPDETSMLQAMGVDPSANTPEPQPDNTAAELNTEPGAGSAPDEQNGEGSSLSDEQRDEVANGFGDIASDLLNDTSVPSQEDVQA